MFNYYYMDNLNSIPEVIRGFLTYHETIKGHSSATVDEYFLDLRTFFRYIKRQRGLVADNLPFNEIPIDDIDIMIISDITLTDIYDYLLYLSRARARNQRQPDSSLGLTASSRARKIAVLRSFFNYLTVKTHQLETSPLEGIDSPKFQKSLPRYLSLDESIRLLRSVEGINKERDYCILCIFLNCGLRISEIIGLNLGDVHDDYLLVLGKGNKERVVYLNDTCKEALADYLIVRNGIDAEKIAPSDRTALFLSTRLQRMRRSSVHNMVKVSLMRAGLDSEKYSSHKLRHTAATLMLKNGVDVRTLQELLGHEHLNTTEIYTHVESTELRMAADAHPLAQLGGHSKDDAGEQ